MYITLLVSAFAVTHIDFTIDSLCKDNNMALAVVPDDYQTVEYPVLAWAHGMGAIIDEQMLENLANAGYVVVASRGCRRGYHAHEHSENQLRTIDWVFNVQQDFKVQKKVAVLGHSMGGRAAIMSSAHHVDYKIVAAVAEMPAIYVAHAETPQVPTFFIGGTRDRLAPWQTIQDWYKRTRSVDKVLGIRSEAGHLDMKLFDEDVIKFLDCYVNENLKSCIFFYPPKETSATDQAPSFCDDPTFKICYTSEYDPANPEAEIEFFHKDDATCEDSDIGENFEGRVPCRLAARMSKLVLGECPMFLNITCCTSCNERKSTTKGKKLAAAPQMQCRDSDPLACSMAAEKMFQQYGQCPRSVAEGCCASCATLKLRAINPDTRLTCKGWPFDVKPRCDDDLSDCHHLAKQGKGLFGECPAFLKIMCCKSCRGDKGKPESGNSKADVPPADEPVDYAYDYPYDSGEPSEPESPNTNHIDDLCPAGQRWNKCGDICPGDCIDGNAIFKCTSNFCVPQCECINKKYKDKNGECNWSSCQAWEDMNTFDFQPFDPSHIPGFDPKPHHKPVKPVGPVHPDNIPIHAPTDPEPADNTYYTGEDYYAESGECVNEDSTRDVRQKTCTEWYDKHPQDCGRYDRPNHGFTARTQCCACYANLSEIHKQEPGMFSSWQYHLAFGFLGGMILALLVVALNRCRRRKVSDMDFKILLDDAQSTEYSLRD